MRDIININKNKRQTCKLKDNNVIDFQILNSKVKMNVSSFMKNYIETFIINVLKYLLKLKISIKSDKKLNIIYIKNFFIYDIKFYILK